MNKRGKFANRIILVIVMTFIAILSVLPFWMMIVMGTYKSNDLYKGIKLWFGDYFIGNLKSLTTIHFMRYYGNSILVATFSSLLTVFVCAMAGYGIGKYKFRGKKTMINIVMLTLMVPTQLSLVGFIKEMSSIGWNNTLLPLIIPSAGNAFGVFWMESYAEGSIPDSCLESARMDGCSEFGVFYYIALPFMRSACVTLLLISFLSSWNAYILPSIVISNESLFTLPLGIKQLSMQFRFDMGAQILGLTLATIPILFLYSFFSDNLISGLAAAAVKE